VEREAGPHRDNTPQAYGEADSLYLWPTVWPRDADYARTMFPLWRSRRWRTGCLDPVDDLLLELLDAESGRSVCHLDDVRVSRIGHPRSG